MSQYPPPPANYPPPQPPPPPPYGAPPPAPFQGHTGFGGHAPAPAPQPVRPQPGAWGSPPAPQPGTFSQPGGVAHQQQRGVRPGMFTGIKGTKPGVSANYIRPGLYWGRIDKTEVFSTRKREERAVVEMTIVRVLENHMGAGHSLGESVSQLFRNSGSGVDYFFRDIVSFIGNTMGINPEEVTEENCNLVFGPTQPLRNTIVEVAATGITSQTTGKPFTRCTFRREITAQEAIQVLEPHVQATFFPNGALQRMVEHERAHGVQPTAPMPAPVMAPAPVTNIVAPPQGQYVPDPMQMTNDPARGLHPGWRWVPAQ